MSTKTVFIYTPTIPSSHSQAGMVLARLLRGEVLTRNQFIISQPNQLAMAVNRLIHYGWPIEAPLRRVANTRSTKGYAHYRIKPEFLKKFRADRVFGAVIKQFLKETINA